MLLARRLGCDLDSVRSSAIHLRDVSSGTSSSQKLFICDRRKYLTPSELGIRINIVWILDTKVTKIIQLPLKGVFNQKVSIYMGTGFSGLLAHLADVCISRQVIEALL